MPGFEVFGDKEKQEIMEVLETGVLFRYEFGEQRQGIYQLQFFVGLFHRRAVRRRPLWLEEGRNQSGQHAPRDCLGSTDEPRLRGRQAGW